MADKVLKIGDKIPKFKIKDFEGEFVTDEDLLGSPFILYFYPKDETPGCTKEACSFRDVMDTFDEMDFVVLGVSPDSPESHRNFMEKNDLNFPLLSDEKLELSQKFGVINGKSVTRSTFICDEDGVIQWVECPVNVEGHVDRVMDAVEEVFG